MKLNLKIIFIGLIALVGLGFFAASILNEEYKDEYENTNPVPIQEEETVSEENTPKILAFGDSITAGYGLDIEESYPSQLQNILDNEGYEYEVINAGLSGDTTAGGLRRIDWSLENEAEIVIVTLGGNDALRGIDPENTRENLDQIFQKVIDSGATLIVGGMFAPENLGKDYTDNFNSIYPDLAQKYSASLIPFFLNGVALNQSLNLPDGIHPTKEGYEIILKENILPVLYEVLEK